MTKPQADKNAWKSLMGKMQAAQLSINNAENSRKSVKKGSEGAKKKKVANMIRNKWGVINFSKSDKANTKSLKTQGEIRGSDDNGKLSGLRESGDSRANVLRRLFSNRGKFGVKGHKSGQEEKS